jgi:hypothetical protein
MASHQNPYQANAVCGLRASVPSDRVLASPSSSKAKCPFRISPKRRKAACSNHLLAVLGRALPGASRTGERPVRIPGHEGRYVIDGIGNLTMRGAAVITWNRYVLPPVTGKVFRIQPCCPTPWSVARTKARVPCGPPLGSKEISGRISSRGAAGCQPSGNTDVSVGCAPPAQVVTRSNTRAATQAVGVGFMSFSMQEDWGHLIHN